jgi:hypothetical protein
MAVCKKLTHYTFSTMPFDWDDWNSNSMMVAFGALKMAHVVAVMIVPQHTEVIIIIITTTTTSNHRGFVYWLMLQCLFCLIEK